ncbi:AraC family transcriptional regulator [Mesorhizobium sp. SB112]|uniref:helix-turn-helix domain-containing protein n=1 Tax=Mesorhizobium sp. SB112 TaxID=3151853 RepID=UPI00326400FD
MSSIKLFRGSFGHVSVLNVAGDFVTHAHREAHVILWLDGAGGVMTIGNEKVAPGPRVAAAINSFQPHSHALSHDGRTGRFLAFYIDPEWANARRNRPYSEPLFGRASIPIDKWLHATAAAIFDGMTDDSGAEDIIDYEVERLIDGLLEAADASRTRKSRGLSSHIQYDCRVRKAIELMQARVCERICFDEVARSVGLSRPHFFALFKQQTNLTPNVYWNTLRMQEALKQLSWSREPLTSLAWKLGFTNQGNFTRFFRDHVGVPPTLYREAAHFAA